MFISWNCGALFCNFEYLIQGNSQIVSRRCVFCLRIVWVLLCVFLCAVCWNLLRRLQNNLIETSDWCKVQYFVTEIGWLSLSKLFLELANFSLETVRNDFLKPCSSDSGNE